MDWLADLVNESPEAMSAEREETVRLQLARALKAARTAAGVPQDSIRREIGRQFQDMRSWIRASPSSVDSYPSMQHYFTERGELRTEGVQES